MKTEDKQSQALSCFPRSLGFFVSLVVLMMVLRLVFLFLIEGVVPGNTSCKGERRHRHRKCYSKHQCE